MTEPGAPLVRGEKRRATDAEYRALASAVRLRILRLCRAEALTNKELAERLGRNPATVLHHVRTLVDTGFLAAEPVRRGTRGSREHRDSGAVPAIGVRSEAGVEEGDTVVNGRP